MSSMRRCRRQRGWHSAEMEASLRGSPGVVSVLGQIRVNSESRVEQLRKAMWSDCCWYGV